MVLALMFFFMLFLMVFSDGQVRDVWLLSLAPKSHAQVSIDELKVGGRPSSPVLRSTRRDGRGRSA